MKRFISTILISLFVTLSVVEGFSQDRQFVRTYQSTVLQKGSMDLEGWNTFRSGRNYFYNALDSRLEMEVGLTDKLQTALYFNVSHAASAPNKDTLGGIADTSASGIIHESELSMSSEWKLKLTDASLNAIGSGLYAEFLISPSRFEIENKLILDKRLEKDIFALNFVNEYEIFKNVQKGKTLTTKEDEVEIDLAYMHLLKQNFGIGFESVNNNEIENKNWNFSALFAGPTIYYAHERYFFILNVLPQLKNLHRTDDAPANLVLNAHEKFEIRLLLGFSL